MIIPNLPKRSKRPSTPNTDKTDAAVRQLNLLFGQLAEPLYVVISHRPPKGRGLQTKSFRTDQLKKAAAFGVNRSEAGEDVYVRICPVESPLPAGKRGTAKESKSLPAVFADLELVKNGHPPDQAIALEIMHKALPLDPMMIINSGHGLHVYWVFKEPLDDMAEA